MPKQVRSVLLGSTGVGKTALCNAFHLKPFKWFNPKPGLNGDYHTRIALDGANAELRVFDAKSDETDAVKRQRDCRHCRVFVVCFSIDSPASFREARDYWLPEAAQFLPGRRIILVGTKADLRWSRDASIQQQLVQFADGEELACSGGADVYLECSAVSGKGVTRVFEEIVRAFRRERNTAVSRQSSRDNRKGCVLS